MVANKWVDNKIENIFNQKLFTENETPITKSCKVGCKNACQGLAFIKMKGWKEELGISLD